MIMKRNGKAILRVRGVCRLIGSRMVHSLRAARLELLLTACGMLSAFAPIACATPTTNHPPIPQDDQIEVVAFGSTDAIVGDPLVPASVLDNDSDPDQGDQVVLATIAANPVCGNLTLNPDGTFTYQSTSDQCLTDSFQYYACDTFTLCAQATAHVSISGANPNYSPVPIDDAIQVPPGGTSTILTGGTTSLLDNDFDPNAGQVLSVDLLGTWFSNYGTYTLNADGTFSYQNTNLNGTTDEFQYWVCDDAALPLCTPGRVQITISDVPNHLPIAVDDTTHVTGFGGTTAVLDGGANSVLTNDSDPDAGQTATLTVFPVPNGGPAHGTLTLNSDGTFSYQNTDPNATSDSFIYQARDVLGATSIAKVTIEMTDVTDQLPVAIGDALQVPVGGTATTLTGGASSVLANDSDPDPGETATLVAHLVGGQPAHGQLTLNADGTFIYHHNGDAATTDSFVYEAHDIHGGGSAATVTITIGDTPVNLPPITVDDAMQVAPGATSTTLVDGASSVLANDFDPNPGDTATLTVQLVGGAPAHGMLTFNPNGTFSYHAFSGPPTTDSFKYKACDIHSACTQTPATVSITIGNGPADILPIAIDDAIQVVPGGAATTLVGGADSVLANDSDPDPGETATLTAKLISANPAHGTLTFNSDGTFSYQHNGDAATSDSFVYEAQDVRGGSSAAVVTITIGNGQPNHLPFAVDDAIDVAPGGTSTKLIGGATSVLANDVDPDPGQTAALTAKHVGTGPSHGTLIFSADGTFSYQNFNGDPATADIFQYEACDIHGACSEGVVTISIGNGLMNHLPVVVDDEIQVVPNGSATTLVGGASSVLTNDFDPDTGETATLSAIKMSGLLKSSGTLTLNPNGTFSYQNQNAALSTDSFLYEACDIHGACKAGTVTVTITNAPMNHLPLAAADAIQVAPGGTATTLVGGSSSVLGNDGDPDPGDSLTAKLIGTPSHGTVTLTLDGAFSYHNTAGDPATTDSFVYEACDPHGACSAGIVSIAIGDLPVNLPPVAVDDSINVGSGGTATILLGGADSVLDNDADPDPGETATLVAELVSAPTHGTLTLNPNGTFSYHNNGDASFNDSFTYRAQDVHTASSNVATVHITIDGEPENHPPIAVDDAIQVVPNGTATTLVSGAASVLTNDSDPDGDPLTAVLVSSPASGTLTLNPNGTFSYHNTASAASDSFQYNACDNGSPVLCTQAIVTITIGNGPINHLPFAVDDAIDLSSGGMASNLVGGAQSVLSNDIDPDAGDTLTASPLVAPTHGILTLASDGTFTYTNANDGAPTDTFTYQVCDNQGACDAGVVTITIGGGQVNHLPIVVDDAIQTTAGGMTSTLIGGAVSVLSNDTDPDPSETATLRAVKMSGLMHASGSVMMGDDGTLTYQNTDPSATTDSFLYEACDVHGACTSGIVSITITNASMDLLPVAVGDAIEAGPNGTATTLVGGSATVLANDSDPDPGETATLKAYLISAASNGIITLNTDGTFVYVNTTNAASDSFQYEACDIHGACAAATVSITINGDMPTVLCVVPRQVDVVGDVVNLDLSLLFMPPPGQSLTYSATNLPSSLSIIGALLSGTLQASDVPGSPYASTLTATTVPGGLSVSENVTFQVLPAGEIVFRDGFDAGNPAQLCQ